LNKTAGLRSLSPLFSNISYQKNNLLVNYGCIRCIIEQSFILLLWFSSWKIMPITDFLSGNVVSGRAPRPAVGARHCALTEVFEGRVPESVAHVVWLMLGQ
jgi:hypothetical protein